MAMTDGPPAAANSARFVSLPLPPSKAKITILSSSCNPTYSISGIVHPPFPCKLSAGNRRFGAQRSTDFLVGRPPVRPLDLGDAGADDVSRRLYLVEASGVGAEEFGLLLLRQPMFLHRLDRAPGVVAVVVVDIGRPAQDVAVEFGEPRRRRLVALEAGHAMLKEGLARQLLQRRQLPLVLVEPVGLVAFVYEEAEPGRRGLEHRRVDFRMPLEEAGHQHHRDPQSGLCLKVLHIGQECVRQAGGCDCAPDQFGAGILFTVTGWLRAAEGWEGVHTVDHAGLFERVPDGLIFRLQRIIAHGIHWTDESNP